MREAAANAELVVRRPGWSFVLSLALLYCPISATLSTGKIHRYRSLFLVRIDLCE